MKNIIIICLLSGSLISSCVSYNRAAKFTSIENIIELKLNSTLQEVNEALGIEPYNILSSEINGYTIYEYRYKLVEREIVQININNKEYSFGNNNETNGKIYYNPIEHQLFLYFKNDKLSALITDKEKQTPPPPPSVQYNISVNGQQSGPFGWEQLKQMVEGGQIKKDTHVWKQGMAGWELAVNVDELASLFVEVPPPPPPPPPAP
ncbi:DUF4339 domain-containing protein [Flavobacteriales bacterium]|nr:DUF4339 domain-containing protein [Flavobacteriales bacterium]